MQLMTLLLINQTKKIKKNSKDRNKNILEVWEIMGRNRDPLPASQALTRLSNLLDEPFF